jgi:galactoside O-acetyltransferase
MKIPKFITYPLIRLGFVNIHEPIVFGSKKQLHLHKTVIPMNTLFNLSSGHIFVDENSFFGHNCMILTGKHTREGLMQTSVPKEGYDIHIGKRCWIASGVIILGGVKIGDDSTIAAGSIITKDVQNNSIIKGVH